MPNTLLNQLLIALFCTTIGFTAGVVVVFLWQDREKKNAPSAADLPEGIEPQKHELIARLWWERKGGKVLTEVDGQVYPGEKPLDNGKMKSLRQVAMQWATWLTEGTEKPSPSVMEAPQPAAPVSASVPQAQPVQPPAQAPIPQAVPLPLPVVAPALLVPPPPKSEPAKPESKDAKKGKQPPPEPIRPMLEEIDEILQEITEGTPLEPRNIRLSDDGKAGVVVWVDGKHYAGLDSVTEEEVKSVIQRAVMRWEHRHDRK